MNQNKTYVTTVVPDPELPGELMLDFDPELITTLGWKEGDTLRWVVNDKGEVLITRVEGEEND